MHWGRFGILVCAFLCVRAFLCSTGIFQLAEISENKNIYIYKINEMSDLCKLLGLNFLKFLSGVKRIESTGLYI